MSYRQKGLDAVKKATTCVRSNQLSQAVEYYDHAISIYKTWEQSIGGKADQKEMVKEILATIKRWKKMKQSLVARSAPVPVGGSKSDSDSSDEEKSSDERTVSEKPNVRWSDIAGLQSAKSRLKEAVSAPIEYPHLFTGSGGLVAWKGLLLYGTPGGGKTMLAKAVATELSCTFIQLSVADIMNKYIGESEKKVRSAFTLARKNKPAVLFLDEVDALCSTRADVGGGDSANSKVVAEFLAQWDGIGKDQSGVLVLGATNLPWALDDAILRRFERRVYLPPPDAQARHQLVLLSIRYLKNTLSDKDVAEIVTQTEGFSGADVASLFKALKYRTFQEAMTATYFKHIVDDDTFQPCISADEPGAVAMTREDIVPNTRLTLRPVDRTHLQQALQSTKSSIDPEVLERFAEWTERYGENGS